MAPIAELVLWIGYLQWHFRTRGEALPHEPVLRNFQNIEHRDAVLVYDKEEFAKDEHGKVKFVWDHRTTKTDSVTGREIPDDKAVMPLKVYTNPRPAKWPKADFIVGNPPFHGDKVMKQKIDEGYVVALRKAYSEVPESSNFVMYWWHNAAKAIEAKTTARFGFITTNSISQSFNRRVLDFHKVGSKLSLRFAIPDHPWVDSSAEDADVRIAMTVVTSGKFEGDLMVLDSEKLQEDGSSLVTFVQTHGAIQNDLSIGAKVVDALGLTSNEGLSVNGMMLAGRGFVVNRDEAKALGLGRTPELRNRLKPLRNGRDLVQSPRDLFVIDMFGLSSDEVRIRFPAIYDHLIKTVKPERDANARPKLKRDWWVFGEPRKSLRSALDGLPRYIATVETARHRIFQFLDEEIVPEHKLVVIALHDAFYLGVLSSRIHMVYALAAGGWLGVGNDPVYAKSRCFDPFPFPDCTEKQKEKIRTLAEELDAHRKRAQAQHGIGLTDLYNVLVKVRAGEALDPSEKLLYEQALVATLRQLHDDLDATVAAAYDWPWPMPDAMILDLVVSLNAARAAEEAKGTVRWLRPDYQKMLFASAKQASLSLDDETAPALKVVATGEKRNKGAKAAKIAWPKPLADRVRVVEAALAAEEKPATAANLATRFARAKPAAILEILQTLVTLGRARPGDVMGTFVR